MYEITDARSFLSGNLNDKLAAAEEAKQHDRSFDKEVQALQNAMPPWIDIAEVAQFGISIGVTWIPVAYYERFCLETFGVRVKLFYSQASGVWEMQLLSTPDTALNMGTWGYSYETRDKKGNPHTKTLPAIGEKIDAGLFTMRFAFKTPKVYVPGSSDNAKMTAEATAKQDAIGQAWTEWCLNNAGVELEKLYNEQLNTKVLRNWDGTGQIIKPQMEAIGCSKVWTEKLRPYQLDAIWRACIDTRDKNGILLGLEVGLGKTPVICATIMLRKSYHTCHKAMVVVQKSTLLQFQKTFREMFPKAKILCATPEDCNGENRQFFLARAAYWQWDAIILTHESFQAIPVKAETESLFLQKRLDAIEWELEYLYSIGETAKGKKGKRGYKGNRIVKKLEEMRNKLREELRLLSSKWDCGIYWEDISCDLLVVDEAQVYKNDQIATKLQVPGISTGDSNRASDFHLKLCYLREKYKQGFLLLSTGTPEPTNSISGIFAMQRYLQPQILERNRMSHFDAWINNFGRVTVEPEQKIDGDIRLTERLKEFVNLPELLQQWLDACHVKRFEDVQGQGNFERPQMKLKRVSNYMTPFQLEEMAKIQSRYSAIALGGPTRFPYTDKEDYLLWTPENAKKRVRVIHPITQLPVKLENWGEALKLELKVDTKTDSYILCYSDARKLMIAPQLLDPKEEIHDFDKIHRCARRLLRWWRLTKEERAVQLVFCDMGTPGGDARFYIYDWLKSWLVYRGVPEIEVQFIQDYKDDEAKEKLFERVNAGEVRILIGSTSPMGIGVNVQERVIAMHLLDIPRRPDEFEQRIGRGVRSGNRYKKVLVYQYLVQGDPSKNYGADAAQFTMLQNKVKMRQAVLRGDPTVRRIVEDDDQQSIYMMLVAHSTGDPGVMDYMKLGIDKLKLESQADLLQREISKLRSSKENSIREAEKNAQYYREKIEEIQPDVDLVRELHADGFSSRYFHIEIGGEEFLGIDLKEEISSAKFQFPNLAVFTWFLSAFRNIPFPAIVTPNKARELALEKFVEEIDRVQRNAKSGRSNGTKQHIGKFGKFNIFAQVTWNHSYNSLTCWLTTGGGTLSKSMPHGFNYGKTVAIKNVEKALWGILDKSVDLRRELEREERTICDRQEMLDKKVEQKKEVLCKVNELQQKRREIQQRLNIKD